MKERFVKSVQMYDMYDVYRMYIKLAVDYGYGYKLFMDSCAF